MVPQLGFGGIPIQRLSEDEAITVVQRCLDLGITFIDTSYAYTTSEERIGKAIAGRREGLTIATKSQRRERNRMEQDLNISLKRLGIDSIDIYQFHGINSFDDYEKIIAPDGPLAMVQEARQAGRVKHIGITSHSMDVAKKAVKSDLFETIMFPFNFVTSEPADELIPLAREHDVGFIAMKPLGGGMLENITVAIKYLLQFPDILILVGIERVNEIEEISQIFKGPQQLTEAELLDMERIKSELGNRFCRRCDYCQPCTADIPISMVMTSKSFFKRLPPKRFFTGRFAKGISKAVDCTKCGDCEKRCPYDLPIREMIEEYGNMYLSEKRKYEEQLKKSHHSD
jgi:predicted aldo/keto reductase-like oxidoreductase